MSKHSQKHFTWQLENLETRQLLSASVGLPPLVESRAALVSPMVKTPSILGTFTGTSTDSKGVVDSHTLHFTGQSHRGVLTGTSTSKKPHSRTSSTQSFTGHISGNSFTLTVDNGDGSFTTVTGTVSANGKTLSGTFATTGGSSTGTFKFTR
jgi:hypothetical protein